MDTRILKEYIDTCEAIKEAELELERLKGTIPTIESDKVKGSMQDFPYIETSIQIRGAVRPRATPAQMRDLRGQIREMEKQKTKVETLVSRAPARMQRIIRYKFFDRLSWEEVADQLGRGATGASVKKEFYRSIKKI